MQADELKIKSYFAASVEQAIQDARRELGDEAVLITSRRAAPEAVHRGAYEVIFGVAAERPQAHVDGEDQDLSREVARLRDQLDNIKRALQPTAASSSGEVETVQAELRSAGLDDAVIEDLLREAMNSLASASGQGQTIKRAASESLRNRLHFARELNAGARGTRQAIVLVGPPGAGKTTSLAKIAMREFLGLRVSVRILSVETHRVASHEKLRSLARIMGFGFTAVNSMRELIEAVDEFRVKDALLIDTPGFGPDDFHAAHDLIQFLRQMSPKEVHLVLPAPMNREDLALCFRRYAPFQPDYLLFTKLDETRSPGAAISVAIEAGKPLSFLASGQSIPEDIEVASATAVLSKLFRRDETVAVPAA
ncbi:MAG TPA: hypothetical protein VKX49_09710 [Bryobacteraceae bacterium]|nr:hypothetical protein [Bryobacteraceae bacterium]